MMPIGVPRVPYRTPKEGGWQWVDIWNCLYRDRIIFLSKPVDEELGNQVGAGAGGLGRRCLWVVQVSWQAGGAHSATPAPNPPAHTFTLPPPYRPACLAPLLPTPPHTHPARSWWPRCCTWTARARRT